MIILNNLVNTGQRMEQEKNILMKDNQQEIEHFFYKNNFKGTMRFIGK